MEKNIKVFSFGALALIIAVGVAVTFLAYSFINSPASSNKQDIVYEIPPSVSFATIAKDLQEKGVVKNAQVFTLLAKFTGQRSRIKVGEYALNTSMKPSEVLDAITSGRSVARQFTVSEGLNMFEIADLYEQRGFGKREEFLKLATDEKFVESLLKEKYSSLEGYLYPETYQITKYTTTKELLTAMVRRFQSVFKEVIEKYPLQMMTARQLVILASLVEKETGSSAERPLIAGVFANRLQKRMMLQTDPTILYGKAVMSGKLSMSITRDDLQNDKNPYNTYVIAALPPGPISNPGRESLEVSSRPPATKYLYFVSKNDGTSLFSETYEEHQKAVVRLQMNAKAREGKSWRDLKKAPGEKSAVPEKAAPVKVVPEKLVPRTK